MEESNQTDTACIQRMERKIPEEIVREQIYIGSCKLEYKPVDQATWMSCASVSGNTSYNMTILVGGREVFQGRGLGQNWRTDPRQGQIH